MKNKNISPKKNFYCGDEVDYDDGKCVEQCDRCVDATGVDYGYLPEEHVELINKNIDEFDKKIKEQKQHLIDMMKQDEELGMYNETFDEYLQRVKDRRTEDGYKYTDEDFETYNEYIMDSWRCGISVYKCLEWMSFARDERHAKQELKYSEEDIESIIAETWIQCVKNDGNNFKAARDGIIEQFKIK